MSRTNHENFEPEEDGRQGQEQPERSAYAFPWRSQPWSERDGDEQLGISKPHGGWVGKPKVQH